LASRAEMERGKTTSLFIILVSGFYSYLLYLYEWRERTRNDALDTCHPQQKRAVRCKWIVLIVLACLYLMCLTPCCTNPSFRRFQSNQAHAHKLPIYRKFSSYTTKERFFLSSVCYQSERCSDYSALNLMIVYHTSLSVEIAWNNVRYRTM
jgi:hypothetical protein